MQGRGLIYKPVVLVLIKFSSVFVCFWGVSRQGFSV